MNKIMLIDDEPKILKSLKRILVLEEYDVITVSSGEEALKKITYYQPQVVVSDYNMPKVNGLDVLEYCKIKSPDSIRLLLTAGIDKTSLIEVINRCGIFYYLSKPIDNIQFLKIIQEAFKLYKLTIHSRELSEALQKANNDLLKSNENLEQEVKKRTGELIEKEFKLRKLIKKIGDDFYELMLEELKYPPHIVDFLEKNYSISTEYDNFDDSLNEIYFHFFKMKELIKKEHNRLQNF